MVIALTSGIGAVVSFAAALGLAIMSHPSLAGAFFHPDHGIAPELLLGDLFRVAGSDAVIYPNVGGDRKSTRLNSSHQIISYAVFCLKKKTRNINQTDNQPERHH